MSVVGNDTETSVGSVFLHDPPKSHLRRRGHGISFVENDELEAREVTPCCAGSIAFLDWS